MKVLANTRATLDDFSEISRTAMSGLNVINYGQRPKSTV